MTALSIFNRRSRGGLLFNQTDHGVQLARLGSLEGKPLVVDAFAELPSPVDDRAIAEWIETNFPHRGSGYLASYCGFHPADRVLLRETINTRRFADPNFLATLLAETAKLPAIEDWHLAALSATDGEPLSATTASRAGLLFGMPQSTVREFQARLCKLRLRPRRIDAGTLPLLGALTHHVRNIAYPHSVVVCEITYTQTHVYFLAKDGVHTRATLPHGLLSIEESAMKELAAPDIATARHQLGNPTEELRAHGRRLVRSITRHLKPAVDYFEMQTGQPINACFSAHLPTRFGWLEESLCAASNLEFLAPDIAAWIPGAGLQLAENTPAPSRSWFQPLSLVANFAPLPANEPRT